jgi:hypothetical protein
VKVSGEHRFSHSSGEVWEALNDPRALAAAVPGARRLEPIADDQYALTVDVGVGSVKGTYEGTFAITDKEPPHACTVRASASGRPGSVSAVARMQLSDDGDGARLSYEADANVTGPLAGVGQRLMGAAARRTTEQFLAALDGYIEEPVPAAERAVAAGRPGLDVVPAVRGGPDPKVIVASALGGFALALVGVAVGRWTARR